MAIYPAGASTDADLYIALDNFSTTLNGAINNSQTTITLTTTTGLPTVGILTIEDEKVHYTGIAGNDITGVTRGFSSTTATSHLSGTAVRFNVVEEHHNGLKDEVKAVEADLVAAYAEVPGSSTIQDALAALNAMVPVGTIMRTPTMPTIGTWAACDGASVSQSTYAALYAAIGHKFLKYTESAKTGPATPGTTDTFAPALYAGNATWLIFKRQSTDIYYSTDDGDTWNTTNAGTFNTGSGAATDGAGTVVTVNVSSNEIWYSTDYGVTWNISADVIGGETTVAVAWNGTDFLIVGDGTADAYSSTNGINWTLQSAVRPTATMAQFPLMWFNSTWIYMQRTQDPGSVVTTTVSDGSSGWTQGFLAITSHNLVGVQAAHNSNILVSGEMASSPIITGTASYKSARKYTETLSTAFAAQDEFPVRVPSDFGVSVGWNGLHFFIFGSSDPSVASGNRATGGMNTQHVASSMDGKTWYTKPLDAENYVRVFTHYCQSCSEVIMDTVNHRMIYTVAINADNTIADWILVVEPSINTGTNFNLPDAAGHFIKLLD